MAKMNPRQICFMLHAWFDADPEVALVVLPIAEPRECDLRQTFADGVRKARADHPGNQRAVLKLIDAYYGGRMLFGWSPLAEDEPLLAWETWDEFCIRHLGLKCDVLFRPERVNEAALADEVRWLESKRHVTVIGPIPAVDHSSSEIASVKRRSSRQAGRSRFALNDDDTEVENSP